MKILGRKKRNQKKKTKKRKEKEENKKGERDRDIYIFIERGIERERELRLKLLFPPIMIIPSSMISLFILIISSFCLFAAVQSASASSASSYQIGEFTIEWNNVSLVVRHPRSPHLPVWATAPDPFLQATFTEMNIKEVAGMYIVEELEICSSRAQTMMAISYSATQLKFSGVLHFGALCVAHSINYSLSFSLCTGTNKSNRKITPLTSDASSTFDTFTYQSTSPNQLCISYSVTPSPMIPTSRGNNDTAHAKPPTLSLIILVDSPSNERVHGFGVQYSVWNLKGYKVPILVSEQGIGRGLQPITDILNAVSLSGGNWHTTYAPVPHYITSRNLSFVLENSEYSVFDLTPNDYIAVQVEGWMSECSYVL